MERGGKREGEREGGAEKEVGFRNVERERWRKGCGKIERWKTRDRKRDVERER